MLLVESPASTSRAMTWPPCSRAAAWALCAPLTMLVTCAVGQAGWARTGIRSVPSPGRCLQVAQHRFIFSGRAIHRRLRQHLSRQRQIERADVASRNFFQACISHGGVRQGQNVQQQDRDWSCHERVRVWVYTFIMMAWNEFSARGGALACRLSGGV